MQANGEIQFDSESTSNERQNVGAHSDALVHLSSDRSTHSLESSISCIASVVVPNRDYINPGRHLLAEERSQPNSTEEDPDPYDMFDVLIESLSSEGSTKTSDTSGLYEAFVSNMKLKSSSSSDDTHTISDDNYYSSGAGDSWFCNSICIFPAAESYDSAESIMHRSVQKSEKKRSKIKTDEQNRKEKKERLRQKLASMDPKAAAKLKSKLAKAKRAKENDKSRNKNGGRNISKDLKKKQAHHLKTQQRKRETKRSKGRTE